MIQPSVYQLLPTLWDFPPQVALNQDENCAKYRSKGENDKLDSYHKGTKPTFLWCSKPTNEPKGRENVGLAACMLAINQYVYLRDLLRL